MAPQAFHAGSRACAPKLTRVQQPAQTQGEKHGDHPPEGTGVGRHSWYRFSSAAFHFENLARRQATPSDEKQTRLLAGRHHSVTCRSTTASNLMQGKLETPHICVVRPRQRHSRKGENPARNQPVGSAGKIPAQSWKDSALVARNKARKPIVAPCFSYANCVHVDICFHLDQTPLLCSQGASAKPLSGPGSVT